MQYHASSLSELDYVDTVTIIGYEGEQILSKLKKNDKIREKRIKPINYEWLRSKSALIHGIVKGLSLLVAIFFILLDSLPYDIILIQNPPCLPVIISAYIINICKFAYKSVIILDWHNLGFTMFDSYKPCVDQQVVSTSTELPIESTQTSSIIKLAKFIELFLAPKICEYHLCVSASMERYLISRCNIKRTIVLYDRPFHLNRLVDTESIAESFKPSNRKANFEIIEDPPTNDNLFEPNHRLNAGNLEYHHNIMNYEKMSCKDCHELLKKLQFSDLMLDIVDGYDFSSASNTKLLTAKGIIHETTAKTICYEIISDTQTSFKSGKYC